MGIHAGWYVVQAESRQEDRVYISLVERQIEAFVPRIEREIAHRKSRRYVEYRVKRVPLLPGYLFARYDFVDRTVPWPAVEDVPGMIGVIADGHGNPLPVPMRDPNFQVLLKAREINGCILKEVPRRAHRFKKDDVVKIVDGPFTSFDGRCISHTGAEVLLRLDGLFGGVRLSVAADFCVAA